MFVVTLPASAKKNPTAFARRAKKAGADLLEIRGDLTPSIKKFSSPLPILLALRGASEKLVQALEPAYLDLELTEIPRVTVPRGTKLIASFHDHERTPALEELKKIVQKICSSKPWMLKIATTVQEYKDLETLSLLRSELQKMKIRATVLGMGPKAHLMRVLSPSQNAFTYACLDESDAAAPGQLTMKFYKQVLVSSEPTIFGILGGSQVSTSASPLMQNALFKRHKIPAVYAAFPTDKFQKTFAMLASLGVSGFSVTAPFKREFASVVDRIDPLVATLCAANTIVKKPEGWIAYNTDVTGIERGYPFLAKAKRIAILGGGGVVSSLVLALSSLAPDASMAIFTRDPDKAGKVLSRLGVEILPLDTIKDFAVDAVVCCISEDIKFPLPKALSGAVAIDLRTNKQTRFLASAAKKGFRVYDGIPMLIHQGLKQFELFTGIAPIKSDDTFLSSLFAGQ